MRTTSIAHLRRSISLGIAVLCLGSTMLSAQERAGAPYVAGTANVFQQDGVEGSAPTTYVAAPGGTTVGWGAAVGLFLSAHVSAEAGFATTGAMTAREPSRYDMIFHEQRRDQFITGAVRFHAPVSRVADVEPVAAFGWIRTAITTHTEYAATPWRAGFFDPEQTTTILRTVFGGGLDVRIGGDRFAVVPSFRFFRAASYPDWPTYYPGGVSLNTIAGGVAIRATF